MSKKQFSQVQVIDALKKSEGFLTPAAKLLGCSTRTLERYIAEYPAVAEAKRESKYRRDDFVEAAIMQRIKAGSDTMIIFYAKTQMKHRGYIERQELQIDDWRTQLIELYKQGKLSREQIIDEFADTPELAAGIIESAGVWQVEAREAQNQSAEVE